MTFIDNMLNQLFPSKEPVVVRSSIKRSDQFYIDFDFWVKDERRYDSVLYLLRMIKLELSQMGTQLHAVTFNNRGSEGIIFGPGELISSTEMDFFMEWISGAILKLGYIEQHNSSVLEEDKQGTKETLRRFLKPRLNFSPHETMDHKFGNITLELIKENDVSITFKILSTVYSDSKYTNNGGLVELIQEIETKTL